MSKPPRPVDPGPRTGVDRLMSWGEANIWGERQPEWYEEPGVWASLSPEDQEILKPHLLAEGRPPVREMAGVTHIKNAAEAVGRAGEEIGSLFERRKQPARRNSYGSIMAPVNAEIARRNEAEYKRLSAEMLLIEFLIRDMKPQSEASAPAPPQTWGVPEPAPYADPYMEQQFQQDRFNEMLKLRRLPPPTE